MARRRNDEKTRHDLSNARDKLKEKDFDERNEINAQPIIFFTRRVAGFTRHGEQKIEENKNS